MKATVKAAKGKDIRDDCGDLRLKAEREIDVKLLTLLYRMIFLEAGTIEFRFAGDSEVKRFTYNMVEKENNDNVQD